MKIDTYKLSKCPGQGKEVPSWERIARRRYRMDWVK
jgi:hypothetical protein